MRTYDEQGRLIGSSNVLTPVDVTANYIEPPMPQLTANAYITVPWYDALLKPPTVYYVGAGLALLAWALNSDKKR